MTQDYTQEKHAKLAECLAQKGWLLADGATGTNLFRVGLETGYPPELWNFEAPEKISALHNDFIDAGADIILTKSFGGNALRLKLHEAEDRVAELNIARPDYRRPLMPPRAMCWWQAQSGRRASCLRRLVHLTWRRPRLFLPSRQRRWQKAG